MVTWYRKEELILSYFNILSWQCLEGPRKTTKILHQHTHLPDWKLESRYLQTYHWYGNLSSMFIPLGYPCLQFDRKHTGLRLQVMGPYPADFYFIISFTQYAIYLHIWALNPETCRKGRYFIILFQVEYFLHDVLWVNGIKSQESFI